MLKLVINPGDISINLSSLERYGQVLKVAKITGDETFSTEGLLSLCHVGVTHCLPKTLTPSKNYFNTFLLSQVVKRKNNKKFATGGDDDDSEDSDAVFFPDKNESSHELD